MRYIIKWGMALTACCLFIISSGFAQSPAGRTNQDEEKNFFLEQRDSRVYLTLQESLIGREFLVFSRIVGSEGPIVMNDLQNSGSRGGKMIDYVMKFIREGDSFYLKPVQYGDRAFSYRTLPVAERLPRFFGKQNDGAVTLDLTSVIGKENKFFYLPDNRLDIFNIKDRNASRLEIKRINNAKSAIDILTKIDLAGQASIDINTSMVLLSKEPLRTREIPFPVNYYKQKIAADPGDTIEFSKNVIIRWRIEPRAADMEKFRKGELVVPEKQIVYVIDPYTPKALIPHFKRGVEAWNKVFEKIGFKDVLVVGEAGSKNIDSSLMYSSHYSMIYYAHVPGANGTYSHVVDPRSGEIIQSPVLISSSYEKDLRNQYFAIASAIDPRVRSAHFSDEVFGALIEKVISHEVGHCLGFVHNMIASNAVNSKDLRSRKFLAKHRCSPSVMDYARYNYVAQPGDGISSNREIMSGIGEYDDAAIKLGYSYFGPQVSDETISNTFLTWKKSGRLKYQCTTKPEDEDDPRNCAETLGNDPIYSSKMGVRNARVVNTSAVKWIDTSSVENRELLKDCYKHLHTQYLSLMSHVAYNILGSYETEAGTSGFKFGIVPEAKQRKAIQFLDEYLFHYPGWLYEEGLGALLQTNRDSSIEYIWAIGLNNIMGISKLERLTFAENGVASATRMLKKLRHTVWSEIYSGKEIDKIRQTFQKIYISTLKGSLTGIDDYWRNTQNKPILAKLLNDEMKDLINDLNNAERYYAQNDSMKKFLQEAKAELEADKK